MNSPAPPHLPDRPPARGSLVVPLVVNLGLMLVVYSLTDGGNPPMANTRALEFLIGLACLAAANFVAMVGAGIAGYGKTAKGLGLSILLLLLVGLGSCAHTLRGGSF